MEVEVEVDARREDEEGIQGVRLIWVMWTMQEWIVVLGPWVWGVGRVVVEIVGGMLCWFALGCQVVTYLGLSDI